MSKPHKHCEVIKAWADGAEIQCLHSPTMLWIDTTTPLWREDVEYRVKPQTIRYRVALYKIQQDSFVTYSVDNSEQERAMELRESFVRWITGWIEVEV